MIKKLIYLSSSPFPLYIMRCGQSNEVGVPQGTSIEPELRIEIPNALIYSGDNYVQQSWSNSKGPEYPFAYKFAQLTGQRIVTEKVAQGSTGFAIDPSGSDWNVESLQLAETARIAYNRLYSKMLEDNLPNSKIVLTWNIGENDSTGSTNTSKENFKLFCKQTTDYITQVKSPDLVLLHLLNTDLPNFYSNRFNIKQAQVELVQENKNWVGNDLQPYPLGADLIHYSYPSIKNFSFKSAETVINKL